MGPAAEGAEGSGPAAGEAGDLGDRHPKGEGQGNQHMASLMLGTSGLGEKEKCLLWGPSPLSSSSSLQTRWSLCCSKGRDFVLCGRYQLRRHCGLSWCLGSPLSGSLCYLWVPGCLPFRILHGPSRKYQNLFLGSKLSAEGLVLGSDSGLGPSIWRISPSMLYVLRKWFLGGGPWVAAPPPPRAFRICSLRFQMVPAPAPTHFRFRASLQGPLHPTGAVPATPKMPYNVPKSSEVERGHLFLDLTVFFQELIFLLHFLRVSFSSPQF